jgi:hypothetical protein
LLTLEIWSIDRHLLFDSRGKRLQGHNDKSQINQMTTRKMITWRGCLAVIVSAVVAGCGPAAKKDENRSTVSGAVTFKGNPLPAGTLVFASSDTNLASTVSIKADGTYSTDRAPIGPNIVTVSTESIKMGNPAAYVAIPNKYSDPIKSGLACDVKPGEKNEVNFDLKP